MFTQEFIDGLSKNPVKAGISLCEEFFDEFTHLSDEPDVDELIRFENARDQIFNYLKENDLDTRYLTGTIGLFSSLTEKIFRLHHQVSETHHYLEDLLIHQSADPEMFLKRDLETGILQILNSDQKQSLQQCINDLKSLIPQIVDPDNSQQERLLHKLKKLRQVLNKKKTDMDEFWSFVGEASHAIKTGAKDTRSFSESLGQMTRIIQQVQNRERESGKERRKEMVRDSK